MTVTPDHLRVWGEKALAR